MLALRRARNLASVVLPYAVLIPIATVIVGLAPSLAVGALVLALSPAELAAPALARAIGGRMETAAAIVTGTLVVSLALLLASFGGAGAGAVTNLALFAFVIGTAVAGSVPMLRDRILPVTRAASYVALAILVVAALVRAGPSLRPETLAAAVALLLAGALASSLVVVLLGGEWRALTLGGGTRDFAVAATLAVDIGGDTAAAVPLAYGALLLALCAVAIVVRRLRA